jgi:hypothetical protein
MASISGIPKGKKLIGFNWSSRKIDGLDDFAGCFEGFGIWFYSTPNKSFFQRPYNEATMSFVGCQLVLELVVDVSSGYVNLSQS